MTFSACSDVSSAAWIVAGDSPWTELVTFGPAGFPAYGRLRFLPDPAFEGQQENDVEADDADESAQLQATLEVLARHTGTPEDCYFCVWDGWGDLAPGAGIGGPKVVVPNRSYFLLRGSLADFGEWRTTPPPAFVWPADHAWCVADDVDPHWAGIGADEQALAALLADPRVDVVPADPRDRQPWYR